MSKKTIRVRHVYADMAMAGETLASRPQSWQVEICRASIAALIGGSGSLSRLALTSNRTRPLLFFLRKGLELLGNCVHSVVACFRESKVDDVLREEVVGAQAAGRAIDIQGFVGLDILGGELEQFAAVRTSQQDEVIVVARHPDSEACLFQAASFCSLYTFHVLLRTLEESTA